VRRIGYIYKITNTVNGKIYIGQTIHTTEWRWNTHLLAAYNNRMGDHNVLFHRAIRKYGIDAFVVEELEKCDNAMLSEREQYWIKKYNSYKEGYNLTIGGEGTTKYEDSDILKYWDMGYGTSYISKFLGCSRGTARLRLISMGVPSDEIKKRGCLTISESNRKRVYQYDTNGKFVKSFYSVREASKEVKCNPSNISEAAQGNIRSAGGYFWSYEKKEKIDIVPPKKGYSILGKYSHDGELVEIYLSLTAAQKNTGISRKKLSMLAEHGDFYKNYYWRYLNIENGIIHIQ
jgi:hypothetical protein